jgi:hypothetical protein
MFEDSRPITNSWDKPAVIWFSFDPGSVYRDLPPGHSVVIVARCQKEVQLQFCGAPRRLSADPTDNDLVDIFGGGFGVSSSPPSTIQVFKDGQLVDDFPPHLFDQEGWEGKALEIRRLGEAVATAFGAEAFPIDPEWGYHPDAIALTRAVDNQFFAGFRIDPWRTRRYALSVRLAERPESVYSETVVEGEFELAEVLEILGRYRG